MNLNLDENEEPVLKHLEDMAWILLSATLRSIFNVYIFYRRVPFVSIPALLI